MILMLRDLIKKAEQGDIEVQYELGRLYRSERLYRYAFHWLLEAAKQGHTASQSAVGEMFLLCRKETFGQDYTISQDVLNEMDNLAKETEQDDKTAFYRFFKIAEQEKINLEGLFENHIRKSWGVEELENILGIGVAPIPFDIKNREDILKIIRRVRVDEDKHDPYYCPRYSPYVDSYWDPDHWDFNDKEKSEKYYIEDLKKQIKEGSYSCQSSGGTDIILAIKEFMGGPACCCPIKYSGRCQVIMLVNKNIYEIPPHTSESSLNAKKYFKQFYDEIIFDAEKRLLTLSKCGRYEDYFVVELPGGFECRKVSMENEKIKLFVENFKKNYKKENANHSLC